MKSLFSYILMFLVIIITVTCSMMKPLGTTQKYTRQIIVSNGDSLIKARILIDPPDIKLEDNLEYYWYYSDIINSNRGGYTGNLLDGSFIVIDGSKNLLTKGNYKNGLKHGEWRIWFPNGVLHYVENWDEGERSGMYKEFDNSGDLLLKSNYKNNLLDGDNFYYYPDTTIVKQFKNGEEIIDSSTESNTRFFKSVFERKSDTVQEEKELIE